MKTMKIFKYLPFVFLLGCASTQRDCSASVNETFGGDWVIAQYGFDGKPINCWNLRNVAITTEEHSEGIYWQDSSTGNLIHLSGWYSRVQVSKNNHEAAAKSLGVELQYCTNGKYSVP